MRQKKEKNEKLTAVVVPQLLRKWHFSLVKIKNIPFLAESSRMLFTLKAGRRICGPTPQLDSINNTSPHWQAWCRGSCAVKKYQPYIIKHQIRSETSTVSQEENVLLLFSPFPYRFWRCDLTGWLCLSTKYICEAAAKSYHCQREFSSWGKPLHLYKNLSTDFVWTNSHPRGETSITQHTGPPNTSILHFILLLNKIKRVPSPMHYNFTTDVFYIEVSL